jgi:transcriptional regulator with XRE-family HTH domain
MAMAQYRELGEELRKRRLAVGWTGGQLAEGTGWSATKVCRIETGQRELSMVELMQYLCTMRVPLGECKEVIQLCKDALINRGYWLSPHGEWLEDSLTSLIFHESTAAWLTIYDPQVVNGLLQTTDYARTWIASEPWRTPDDVERCVLIRRERQRILYAPHPKRFSFFVHEQALRRQVGGAAILYQQLLKLNRLATRSHISLRVVPQSAGEHSAFRSPFRLFEYPENRPLVYLDSYSTGLFLDDPEYVGPFRRLVPVLSEVALGEGQSRELIATLANEYGQGSELDADNLEEEQL